MIRLTKYSKKLRWVYFKSAVIIATFMIIFFPWFMGISKTDEGSYNVFLNGEKIGVVGNEQMVNNAYLTARLQIEDENEASVYVTGDLQIKKSKAKYGKKMSEETLTKKLYEVLAKDVEVKEKAYVVDIEGYMVTLRSKDEVISLLDAVKKKYDPDAKYTTILKDDGNERFPHISYEFVDLTVTDIEGNLVTASEDGETVYEAPKDPSIDGLTDIRLYENVEIIEAYVSPNQLDNLEVAIEDITKEKAEKVVYEVKAGDTLSSISRQYEITLDELLAMNPDFTEEGIICIGDRLTVTVPEPELSVVTVCQKTYEEYYDLPIVYTYNPSQYTTYSAVVNAGSSGYREVVADITYVNGIEVGRTILSSVVMQEAVARVIEIGTIVPPTFIKPVSGGGISWGYNGAHLAVDWAVSTGSAVVASASGTVISAGWNGVTGYTVIMSHGNGVVTRYQHLSQILCYTGQYVQQGSLIARSGATGSAAQGAHLHFAIWVNGYPVNPLGYVR